MIKSIVECKFQFIDTKEVFYGKGVQYGNGTVSVKFQTPELHLVINPDVLHTSDKRICMDYDKEEWTGIILLESVYAKSQKLPKRNPVILRS